MCFPMSLGFGNLYLRVCEVCTLRCIKVLHVAIPYTQGAHWVTQMCHHGAV